MYTHGVYNLPLSISPNIPHAADGFNCYGCLGLGWGYRYDVGSSDRVFWWPLKMKTAGEIVGPVWVHSHRARYRGMVLVAGAHSMHSLTGIGPECATSNDPACHDIAVARQRLVKNAGLLAVCHDSLAVPNYLTVPSADGAASHYDRPGEFLCDPFRFEEGQVFTVFSFSGPVYHPGEFLNSTFPQHTMIFAYFRIPPESRYNLNTSAVMMLNPRSYGMWEVALPRNYSDAMPYDGSNAGAGIVFNYTIYNETFDLETKPEMQGAVVTGGGKSSVKRVATDRSGGILLSATSMRTWITIGTLAVILLVTVVRLFRHNERAPVGAGPR